VVNWPLFVQALIKKCTVTKSRLGKIIGFLPGFLIQTVAAILMISI
jgi:hypothetical protein